MWNKKMLEQRDHHLERSEHYMNLLTEYPDDPAETKWLAAAQVHATLAVAYGQKAQEVFV